jgi:hypothetical protein
MVGHAGAQRQALDAILEASREIDRRHGTRLTQQVWENIVGRQFQPLGRP